MKASEAVPRHQRSPGRQRFGGWRLTRELPSRLGQRLGPGISPYAMEEVLRNLPGCPPSASDEVFNALGDALTVITVADSALEPLRENEVLCARGMAMAWLRSIKLLSAGAPSEEILEDYPDLERDDILAAIEFAAQQADHVVLQGVWSSMWTISKRKQVLLETFRPQLPRIVSELEGGS